MYRVLPNQLGCLPAPDMHFVLVVGIPSFTATPTSGAAPSCSFSGGREVACPVPSRPLCLVEEGSGTQASVQTRVQHASDYETCVTSGYYSYRLRNTLHVLSFPRRRFPTATCFGSVMDHLQAIYNVLSLSLSYINARFMSLRLFTVLKYLW
jgi:hypothetical protein